MKESLIRSFIAIDVGEELKQNGLSKVQAILRNNDYSRVLKLVKPENIHITLRFLGEIDSSLVNQISECIDRISFNPFIINIKGLGVFPNFRRIRVIWAGIENGNEEIKNLSYRIENEIRKLGFPSNKRKYNPHLTIARVRSRNLDIRLIETIKEFEDFEFGFFKVEFLELKRSVLTPRGPRYSTLFKANTKSVDGSIKNL
jgi:2'-5' RNA ligase